MAVIRFSILGLALLVAAILLFSCNLEDFNLKKLTNKEDIIPDVYAPLAYGKFKVSDLVTTGPLDKFQIPIGGLPLNSIILSKTGTSFRNAAIDSVYLITHFTNNTPCDMSFDFSFFDSTTGLTIGKTFPPSVILAGAVDSRIQFDLGPLDQDNLAKATDIKFSITISSPAGSSILYKAAKNTEFTINLSFYAPVNLRKL